jgi:hypothetical protein
VVEGFLFTGGRADPAVQATVVEPLDVGEQRELEVVEAAPWTLQVEQLGLDNPIVASARAWS